MKKHVKIALKARKLYEGAECKCEICGRGLVIPYCEIHHIKEKGMGGRANADTVENLILCCVDCHNAAHRSEYKPETLMYKVKLELERIS